MHKKISFLAVTLIGLSFAGCSQPSDSIAPQNASSNPAPTEPSLPPTNPTAAAVPPLAPPTKPAVPPPATIDQTTTTTTQPTANQAAETQTAVNSSIAKPNPTPSEPSTAVASLNVLDILAFPRINQTGVLEQLPTYVYYSGESSVQGADAFYQSEFKARGWVETISMSPPSEQYSDRLFTKDGHFVRATVSSGSKSGEIGVNLSNLGNVDVRLLPKMEDAAPMDSTAVNAGHETSHSIIEVAETLSRKLSDAGWQEVRDFFTPDIDVPHYRSIKYRKNAMRINLGIYRDPKNPSEKTKVFYHSEFAIPFDIPTYDHRKLLKLDLTSMKAAFEFDADQTAMLDLFEKSSERFGWKFKNAEPFQKGDAASLLISSGPNVGIIARLATEKEKGMITMERIAMPDAKSKDKDNATDKDKATEQVASSTPLSTKTNAKSDVETEMDQVHSIVSKAIDLEMQKALGSLNGGASGSPMANMADLQAKAAAMMKSLGAEETSPTETESKPNPISYLASNDKDPIDSKDLSISLSQCVIQTGKETHTLKHLLAYNQVEGGTTTKVLMFSNKPLNEQKLKRMLASQQNVSVYDIGGFTCGPTIEMKISSNSVMINAAISGGSMSTNSSDIKSTVRYRDGKMQGRVTLNNPMKMFDDTFAFEAQVNQPVLQIDSKSALDGQNIELMTDPEYEFPIPENCSHKSIEGTKYLKQIGASILSPLKSVEAFYRKELNARGYLEKKDNTPAPNSLAYANTLGTVEIRLSEDAGTTTIAMNVKNTANAKADRMVARNGKALALLGNLSSEAIEVTIAGKSVQVPAGMGAKDPKEAMRLDLEPGKHQVVWKTKSGKTTKEELEAAPNTTWGVIFDMDFETVMRLY